MNRHITGILAAWLALTCWVDTRAQSPAYGAYPAQQAMHAAPYQQPPHASGGVYPAGGTMPMMAMGVQPASYSACDSGGCDGSGCGIGGCQGGCGGGLSGLTNWWHQLHDTCQAHLGYDGCQGVCQHGPDGDGGCCLPRWFDAQAEWLFWKRDDASSRQFSSRGILGTNALDANQLDYSETSGFRVTGAYLIGPSTAVELGYFGGFNWNDSAYVTGNGDLFSLFSDFGSEVFNGTADTDFANLHGIAASSEMDNLELNVRRRWVSANCLFHSSVLAGVRYFRFREDLTFLTRTDVGGMNYDIKADNDLVGAQLGTDLFVCLTPRLRIGAEVEGGVYGTSSSQRTNVFAALSPNVHEYSKDNDVAFIGEAGATALYRVTSHLTFRIGYQVLYVDGIATALGNVDARTPFSARIPVVNNNSDLFFHGSKLGFEVTW